MGRFVSYLFLLFCLLPFSVHSAERVASPFYGTALYPFYQDRTFSAIVTLEAEQQRGRLAENKAEARLLLGGLYLGYGMHRQAEVIFEELLMSEQVAVRDQAWLFLAKIRYQRGFYDQAQQALNKIEGSLPDILRDDQQALLSLLMFESENIQAVSDFRESESALPFSDFNRAMLKLRSSEEAGGLTILNRLADQDVESYSQLIFRDRVNLALGEYYLGREQFDLARISLAKVSLGGLYSNQALLALGWAALGANERPQALAVWSELLQGQRSDPAVQEAYLTIPYLYFGARQFTTALQHYQRANDFYQQELAHIDQVINSDSTIKLLAQLAEPNSDMESGWRWQSEISPASSLDFYLVKLLSSHRFQEALKNYRDLLFMRDNLQFWRTELSTYDDMQGVRKAAYDESLFKVSRYIEQQNPEENRAKINLFSQKISAIELSEDEFALRRNDENEMLLTLKNLRERVERIADRMPDSELYVERLRILDGLLTWRLVSEYPIRLWNVKKEFIQLEKAQNINKQQYDGIDLATENQAHNFLQYGLKIRAHAQQIESLSRRVGQGLNSFEKLLKKMLISEMALIKSRLEIYLAQTQVSIAHIHDIQTNHGVPRSAKQPD